MVLPESDSTHCPHQESMVYLKEHFTKNSHHIGLQKLSNFKNSDQRYVFTTYLHCLLIGFTNRTFLLDFKWFWATLQWFLDPTSPKFIFTLSWDLISRNDIDYRWRIPRGLFVYGRVSSCNDNVTSHGHEERICWSQTEVPQTPTDCRLLPRNYWNIL